MTGPDPSSPPEFPSQLASTCLRMLRHSDPSYESHLSCLVEMATSADPDVAKKATGAIFGSLVEPLADSFEPAEVSLCNQVFSRIIQSCRKAEPSGELDRLLTDFGLRGQDEILARAERLRPATTQVVRPDSGRVVRVIVLSRVTLGADVAITSVIVERVKERFPTADVVLLGGRKSEELFGGDPRLSFRVVDYRRNARLTDRLLTWVDLVGVVQSLIGGLQAGEYLIADPDTRLTQLGLLPLTASQSLSPSVEREVVGTDYLFFPSREYGWSTTQSLSELASKWVNDLLCFETPILPHLSLKAKDRNLAVALTRTCRRGNRPIVLLNFGVGENVNKRIGEEFENEVVSGLISDKATVILDRGAGERESSQVDGIADHIRGLGFKVIEFSEETLPDLVAGEVLEPELLVCRGRIGIVASLISNSDLYIGYDSAGQHIAAALGIPCIDIMAGFSSPRIVQRWRPTGPAAAFVLDAQTVLEERKSLSKEVLRIAGEVLKRKTSR